MPYYESVVIARQDLSAQQVEQLTDELAEVIKAGGGEIAKRESWGLRNLAYKIKKNRKGHYVLMNLDAPAEAVTEYERIMRFNEDILRYLTVRVKELDPEPSAVLQNRGGRDDRRGPRGDRGDRGDRGPRGDRGGDRGPRRDRDERPENRAGE
ncbi:30S ribosomal protein S6 [Algihabitans sp.]|uniref:30S ribosomal protein S6 n=1 Tax=Algihabitans sp. TaxID=2821514 RepID=UPI003BA95EF0